MKITQSDREKLVVTDFPYVLGGILMLVAMGALGNFAWNIAQDGFRKVELVGHICFIGLPFLGAYLLLKRSVFEFDLARRQLIWSRTGLLGRRGATVPFSQINRAYVDSNADLEGGDTYRVSLKLNEGDLPLTTVRSGGIEFKCKKVRDEINRALGVPLDTETEIGGTDEIRAMVARGKKIAAIKLVREQRRMSLAAAKDFVESLEADRLVAGKENPRR